MTPENSPALSGSRIILACPPANGDANLHALLNRFDQRVTAIGRTAAVHGEIRHDAECPDNHYNCLIIL